MKVTGQQLIDLYNRVYPLVSKPNSTIDYFDSIWYKLSGIRNFTTYIIIENSGSSVVIRNNCFGCKLGINYQNSDCRANLDGIIIDKDTTIALDMDDTVIEGYETKFTMLGILLEYFKSYDKMLTKEAYGWCIDTSGMIDFLVNKLPKTNGCFQEYSVHALSAHTVQFAHYVDNEQKSVFNGSYVKYHVNIKSNDKLSPSGEFYTEHDITISFIDNNKPVPVLRGSIAIDKFEGMSIGNIATIWLKDNTSLVDTIIKDINVHNYDGALPTDGKLYRNGFGYWLLGDFMSQFNK